MENSNFKDFTSGGQITMHSVRMFGQAVRSVLLFCGSILITLLIIFTIVRTKPYDRYILSEYIEAQMKIIFQGSNVIHNVKNPNGLTSDLYADQFIQHPATLNSLKNCLRGFLSALRIAILGSLFALFGFCYFFKTKGKKQRDSIEITGQVRVDPKKIKKLLQRKNMASQFSVAGVPLLKDSEVQHILLTGTTGAGKSVCLQELMDQIREKKQRAIIYDIEGIFIPQYYREGKDIILNPLDERSPAWNIWQECVDAADFEAIASSLMPLHLAGTDPFWIHSARTIFSSAAQRLQKDNKMQMKELLQPMFSENLGSLASLVNDSVAETLVSDKNEKTALSIKATLSTYCKALMYLKEDTGENLFSIRHWISKEEADNDSWLFIASNAQKVEALKPLISVWLDVAAKSVLSLTPSLTRRLWFIMDELPSLHRLPSFMNTLSRGRKYGSCFVGVIQDIHQLRSIYGRDEAETLTALFNTNVCYRTKCPDSAIWMSKVMGGLEMMEKREGYSYGANDMRDGVSIHQERRREPVVKDTEFLELDDLHAFLRLPGNWPVTQLKFDIKQRAEKEPALIERDLSEVLLFERGLAEKEALEDPKPFVSISKGISEGAYFSIEEEEESETVNVNRTTTIPREIQFEDL